MAESVPDAASTVQVQLRLAQAELARRDQEPWRRYYPDCTPACRDPKSLKLEDHAALCRTLYTRHLDFFRAGKQHRERLALMANRLGKSVAACFELTCHLTGDYPRWWEGRRFHGAVNAWAAGDTMLTTRNILQVLLMGPIDNVDTQQWSGLIPCDRVVGKPTRKSGGISHCLDTVRVRRVNAPRPSTVQFLSYDQGRRAFQGTSRHIVLLDEEPPEGEDIYGECLTRVLDVDGIMMLTFTPLRGFTAFLAQWCETAVYLDRDGTERPASQVFGVSAS